MGVGGGGDEGALCVPRAGKQPELLAGIAGTVGRGRLASVPPRPVGHQPAGVEPRGRGLGDMTLERLGESKTCHLSVPCGHH